MGERKDFSKFVLQIIIIIIIIPQKIPRLTRCLFYSDTYWWGGINALHITFNVFNIAYSGFPGGRGSKSASSLDKAQTRSTDLELAISILNKSGFPLFFFFSLMRLSEV